MCTWREGRVHGEQPSPSSPSGLEESAVCHISTLWQGGGGVGDSSSRDSHWLWHWATTTHLARSSSLIVHHQPSLHVPPPQNAQNSSLKAQFSEWPLPLQVILESGWPALASSPREKHAVFLPYHRVETSLMSCSWALGYRVRNEGNTT